MVHINETYTQAVLEFGHELDSIELLNILVYTIKKYQNQRFIEFIDENNVSFKHPQSLSSIKNVEIEYMSGISRDCSVLITFNVPSRDGIETYSIFDTNDVVKTEPLHIRGYILESLKGFKYKSSKHTLLLVSEMTYSGDSSYVLSLLYDRMGIDYYFMESSTTGIYRNIEV